MKRAGPKQARGAAKSLGSESLAPRLAAGARQPRSASPEPSRTSRSGPSMLIAGICELTLEVEGRHMKTMERFYCAVLGCDVLAREPDRVWISCGKRARLGLWTPGEKEFGDEGGRRVHFACAASPGNLDAVGARLIELGLEHKGPVQHEGGDRSIYTTDPMGNVVEVWDFFEDFRAHAPEVHELA